MLFNSIEFLYFFLVVTTLFFVLPHKARWALLLSASCFFYMFFKPVYILILAFTIVVDYFAGIFIEKETDPKRKKLFLVASLIANIGVLAVFKYYNFLNLNFTLLTNFFHVKNTLPYLHILLPIGLSFHTFQAMSYTIEVYNGKQKAEKHFGIYSLYVMFYPQLVAGPIERPQNILHQFHEKKYFNYDNALAALNLIALGLFKKVVIADRLSVYVNQVYGDIHNANSVSAFLAVCFFSVQIYCDFSGYSDIARGTAKMMGYDLMINFDRPYLAQSITEFWTRWHISLSTWFRDYVYIPLGGNRVKRWKMMRNLVFVFMLSGLWHGANWTFVVWGGLHACYILFGMLTKKIRAKFSFPIRSIAIAINRISVFGLVTFSWIFFRAANFLQAKEMIRKLFSFDFSFNLTQLSAEKGPLNLLITLFTIGLLAFITLPKPEMKSNRSIAFLIVITFLIIILGKNESIEFIYFQF